MLKDDRERSILLTNLLCDSTSTTEPQRAKDTITSQPSPPLWRLNLEAIVSNVGSISGPFPKFHEAGLRYEGNALFVRGEHSKFVRGHDEAEVRRLFPRAEFVTVPESGHWVHIEKREEFVRAVVPFLEAK